MITIITYGTYDLLHIGHIRMLQRCRSMGDRLIVALSTDAFNARMKGKFAVQDYTERKEILESLRFVDMVIPETSWEQKTADIQKYDVDIFIIGDDWQGKFDFLRNLCTVLYLPRTQGVSTTIRKREIAETTAHCL